MTDLQRLNNLSEDFHDVAKSAHTFINLGVFLQHSCVMLSLVTITQHH